MTLREHLTEISLRHHWKGMKDWCVYCSLPWPCPDKLDSDRALAALNESPSVGKTAALSPHPGWREVFDPEHPDVTRDAP